MKSSKYILIGFCLLSLLASASLFGQREISLNWVEPIVVMKSDLKPSKKLYFQNAYYTDQNSLTPSFYVNQYINGLVTKVLVEVNTTKTKALTTEELKLVNPNLIPDKIQIKSVIKKVKQQSLIQFFCNALINEDGVIKKVLSFNYQITPTKTLNKYSNKRIASGGTSVLATGKLYKIGVTNTGIHKISKEFLTTLGVNVSTINPKNIRLFGNSTGMLPEESYKEIPLTLQEAQIHVEGQEDNVFNDNDFILFYGKGPHDWDYNESTNFYNHRFNLYADTAYYFLNFDQGVGKRIDYQSESSSASNYTVSTFDDHQFHELDNINLIKTGKKWLGEYFDITKSYSHSFSFPNIVQSTAVKVKAAFAVRSFTSSGNSISLSSNGSTFFTKSNISAVSSNYTSTYAREVSIFQNINVNSSSITIGSTYSKPEASSVAWLDFLTLNASRYLKFTSGQMSFRNAACIKTGNVTEFNLSHGKDIILWDVTNPLKVHKQGHRFSGGIISFKTPTENLKQFVAFDGSSYLTPRYIGTTSNQNILAYTNKEYLLICPPSFKIAGEELIQFHASHSGLSGSVVTTDQIYNEFSSGAQDISAIRNFVKFLYENSSTKPAYLMLLGDGSYDYKSRISGNTNFVPAFQSNDSYDPIYSFTSDDFYGLLNDSSSILSDLSTVDIAIGRFPAKSVTEARDFVKKVKNYVSSSGQHAEPYCSTTPSIKKTFGSWKNSMMMVADDGNSDDNYSNSHLLQTELIIDKINDIDSTYNIKKVYLDSYKKVAGPGGGSYPEVARAINDKISQGTLAMSYIGHGGEAGWADERILKISDINSWENFDRLPLFLTATCEFSRYDDPERVAAGEYVILNPKGGAIALMTTVRLVFGGLANNIGFSINYFKNTLSKENNNTLGQALVLTKNESPMGNAFNKRKFLLLGDPAVKLGVPSYKVSTTSIVNSKGEETDTLKALSKIKITGEIKNSNGTAVTDFNGIIYPTIYDVYQKTFTLDNNEKGRIDSFQVQNNILFKGKASVKAGKFEFEFLVPKDISYSYGEGKMSYYCANQTIDGSGYSKGFKIGGTADFYELDQSPPQIEILLNDSNFVSGGLTNESPVLIINLEDESGINTSSAGIGHDITAVLDGNLSSPFVLNEYYEAKLDDYRGGSVTYPLRDLSEGPHTITVKAWDIQNNSASASIDFVVANSSELALSHVLNYPNPFSTNTDFYFEHNHHCSSIEVEIQIFTISGKLVKTIFQTVPGHGNLKGNAINWDGKDEYGDTLGKGVYLYKLKAKTSDGLEADKLEKLVILN